MAREIVVSLAGEVSRFGLVRVQREKLYGKKKRIVVDPDEEVCVAGMLTRDGTALIPPGGIANLYVDEQFNVVERKNLRAVDADGTPVDSVRSTLGVEQELTGPISPDRVLDHVVTAVYQLDAGELGDQLSKGLESGDIYEMRFAYRGGFDDNTAFLLQSSEGVFALVGIASNFEFLRRDAPVEEEDETDPFEDDFDFSMM